MSERARLRLSRWRRHAEFQAARALFWAGRRAGRLGRWRLDAILQTAAIVLVGDARRLQREEFEGFLRMIRGSDDLGRSWALVCELVGRGYRVTRLTGKPDGVIDVELEAPGR